MNWGGMSQFLAMGGYGSYVWGSYAVTALIIAVEIGLLVSRSRTARRQLRKSAPAGD